MSVRSASFIRNIMFSKALVPAFRPITRAKPAAFSKPMRYYTSPTTQQETSKISSLASSPEIIQAAKAEPKESKLKGLAKKYGVVGVLVYLGVGVVDLGVTFGIIQVAGLDKVKALEKGVLDVMYNTGEKFGMKKKQPALIESDSHVVLNNEQDTPSLASVFLLAYGIHKTLLLPVRLGITTAITPAIVRKLHQMGWARYFPRLLGGSVPKKP